MQEDLSVLIPDGESGFALFVAHCLSNFPNVRVHVLSNLPVSPARFSRYCQSYMYTRHEYKNDLFLQAIRDAVRKHNVDVLLPTDTKAIAFVIANRQALSAITAIVPLPDLRTFNLANNKWLMAQFLKENQIASPPSLLVEQSDNFLRELQDLKFPVLLKPVTSRGGDGIERFDRLADLTKFLDQQDSNPIEGRYIAQSYLSGSDVSLNILSCDGKLLALTVQKGIIPNTQRFGGPGALQFIDDDRFTRMAEKLVSTLVWSGYACVDILCDGQENLYVLDMNARFWASVRGSWVAGVSFPFLACQAALGTPFELPAYAHSRYFHPKTAVRESISALFGRSQIGGPAFHETDLKFLLKDPLAETLRVFNQEYLDI